MKSTSLIKRSAALVNTQASHYQILINKATTEDKISELAIELQSLAIVHGRGLIEARFWHCNHI